jgi:hypothetical protein
MVIAVHEAAWLGQRIVQQRRERGLQHVPFIAAWRVPQMLAKEPLRHDFQLALQEARSYGCMPSTSTSRCMRSSACSASP